MIRIIEHIFKNDYENNLKSLKFTQYSIRYYGQSKLEKPKELKGIKEICSIYYIPKHCKCKIFIKNSDVWIQHRDYFSSLMKEKPEDFGTPLEYRANKYLNKNKSNKFIYPDCWGSIVLRNEAWLCIKNFMSCLDVFETNLIWDILRQQEKNCGFEELELENTDMSRFWEKVIKKCKEQVKKVI